MALTPNLGATHMEAGQAQPHIVINEALDVLDKAIAGRAAIDVSAGGSITLTAAQSTLHMLNPYGTVGAAFTLVVQAASKTWVLINDASQDCTLKTAAGTGVVVQAGRHAHVYCDGANVHFACGPQVAGADQAEVAMGSADGEFSGLTFSATPTQAECQALRDKCEELADDVRSLVTLVHAVRYALVAAGTIKGGA